MLPKDSQRSSDWIYPGEGRYRGTLPDRPNYPTVNHGKSIPVVYGTERVTPRVVLFRNMGSALLWKGDGVFPWKTYWGPAATAVLAICEAPVAQVGVMYIDGLGVSQLASNMFYRAVAKDSAFTWVAAGDSTSSPAFLASTPAAGMAFQGTCYFAAQALRTDNGKMPNITFQVTGRCAAFGGGSAAPADVAIDLLTNARYGVGLAPAQVVTDVGLDGTAASSYRTYCTAMGWVVNRTVQEQEDAASLLRDLLLCTNAEAVFTDGKLVIVPLGDAAVGSYVPPTPVLLDQNEMLFEPGNDPVQISRTPDSEVFNYFPVRIRNQNSGFNDSEYVAEDTAHSSVYGQRKSDGYDAKWLTDPALALKLSSLFAQRSIAVRNTYRFRLKARWALLDQMDVVSLTEPVTGLSQVRCRIRSIRKASDGAIEVEAEEAPGGAATPIDLTPQTEDGYAGESVQITTVGEVTTELGTKADADLANVPAGSVTGLLIADSAVSLAQLAAGSVDATKLATGLEPIRVVAALPGLPNASYPQGAMAFLTADNKVYRSTGTAWTAIAGEDYVQSRGMNLVANGTAMLGTNFNFSAFTFSGSETAGAQGSFYDEGLTSTRYSDEYLPVDPGKTYELRLWAKCVSAASPVHAYFGGAFYDVDKNLISPYDSMFVANTLTTLAAPLKPGDTTITLTSAANWLVNGAASYQRQPIIWGYRNSRGYAYPASTYSRINGYRHASYQSTGAWAVGGIAGNVITLASAWPTTLRNPDAGDGAWPAGTPISNATSGAGYKYFAGSNVTVPLAWTEFRGTVGGTDSSGTFATNMFPPGAAFVRILFLLNRDTAGVASRTYVSTVWLSELAGANLTDGSIQAAKIAAGAIDQTKLASGIRAVTTVSALPTLPSASYPQGAVVFLTTDNKLYRSSGSAWTSAVPAADLSGQITSTQITDDAVTTAKIAANAVTATELSAGAVTAGKIAADAITANEIQAGAIGTSELAAGAVVTAKLGAGSVTANELAANSVIAGKIATDAVDAAQIKAGAIQTAKLAAGAVTANELAVGAVIAGKLAANAVTAGTIATDAVRSADYAEDGSGNPTAGFKWLSGGTGIVGKIGPGGCLVGPYTLDAAVLAALTALARNQSGVDLGRVWYRGNVNPLFFNGAPRLADISLAGVGGGRNRSVIVGERGMSAYSWTGGSVADVYKCVQTGTTNNGNGGATIWSSATTYSAGQAVLRDLSAYGINTYRRYVSRQSGNLNHEPYKNDAWWRDEGWNSGPLGSDDLTYATIPSNDIIDGTAMWRRVGTIAAQGERLAVSMRGGTYQSTWAGGTNFLHFDFFIRPKDYEVDNLESLRYLEIEVWSDTTNKRETLYVPIPDRAFKNAAVDDDAANEIRISYTAVVTGVAVQMASSTTPGNFTGYLRVKIWNAYGSSDTRDYFANAQTAMNATMVPGSYTLGGSTGGGSSGGGGADPGGGYCPAWWVPVRTANRGYVLAADVRVGDVTWTVPENGGAPGPYMVSAVSTEEAHDVLEVRLRDGRVLAFSSAHRLLTVDGWRAVRALEPGVRLLGPVPGELERVAEAPATAVVRITVDGAHTYETLGITSHNSKKI
jgi:hypothetical protein